MYSHGDHANFGLISGIYRAVIANSVYRRATDWTTGVRFLAGARDFYNPEPPGGCGAHPASYPMGTGNSIPGNKTVAV
jgi:hypothetical protein